MQMGDALSPSACCQEGWPAGSGHLRGGDWQ